MKKIIRTIMISVVIAILTACSGRNVSMETAASSEVSSENVVTSSELTSENASDDTEAVRDVFAMDTYMTVKAYGPNGDAAVEAAVDEIPDWMHCCPQERKTARLVRLMQITADSCQKTALF